MRTSQLFFSTLREIPSEAEIISHQLMLRAGLIRALGSGLYSWLPLGVRILQKIEAIIREELNAISAQELRMPCIQPAQLWQESERWDKFGEQLLKIYDRHQHQFCFGPTHEEVVTDLIRQNIHSYKQLPLTVYQITTKFRDEIRPRFGVMRSREFIMKDAYSFHLDTTSLQITYDAMYQAYSNIFTRLGLNFRAVLADTGAIGGKVSHEFQVLADAGEDIIVYSDSSDYAANIEQASSFIETNPPSGDLQPLQKIATPNHETVTEICQFLTIKPAEVIKTLIVKGLTTPYVALCLRGDQELNPLKAEKLSLVASPLEFASESAIEQIFGCPSGSLGPIECPIPLIVDYNAYQVMNFCCGANEQGYHFCGSNWHRDVKQLDLADIHTVVVGERSPDGKGYLQFTKGIEVGHIFQVGPGYSEKLQATVLDKHGKTIPPWMGCYGIGITRIVAAAIEQHHDALGIIWPQPLAPYTVVLIPIQYHKSPQVKCMADELYQKFQQAGIEILLDDRHERPGVMFADMDLLGIPHRVTISEKTLTQGLVEYKSRRQSSVALYPTADIISLIQSYLSH